MIIGLRMVVFFALHSMELLHCQRSRSHTLHVLFLQVTPEAEIAHWFWEVLLACSDSEKEGFLNFVWAKSRLPASAAEFPLPMKIEVCHRGVPKLWTY